jgi:hypothetical protein
VLPRASGMLPQGLARACSVVRPEADVLIHLLRVTQSFRAQRGHTAPQGGVICLVQLHCFGAATDYATRPLQARQYQDVCSALAEVESSHAGTVQDLRAKYAAVERLEGEGAALRAQLKEGSALLEAANARAAALLADAAAMVRDVCN